MGKLTKDEIATFTEKMRTAAAIYDTERSHPEMDEVLLQIAEAVGCTEAAEIFRDAEKWYS